MKAAIIAICLILISLPSSEGILINSTTNITQRAQNIILQSEWNERQGLDADLAQKYKDMSFPSVVEKNNSKNVTLTANDTTKLGRTARASQALVQAIVSTPSNKNWTGVVGPVQFEHPSYINLYFKNPL